jgi:hypothetical protein
MRPGFTDRDAVLNSSEPLVEYGVKRFWKYVSPSLRQVSSAGIVICIASDSHHEREKHADTCHDAIPDGRVKDLKHVKTRQHYIKTLA